MEAIHSVITWLNGYLWGTPLLVFLMGTHLLLTVRLRFIQRHIFKAIRLSVTRDGDGYGEISQFGALVTALAATVGTGNIIGVATALSIGGPCAIFWMWMTGVLGIATKYSEALLSVKYRTTSDNGSVVGGPMYVIEKGLGIKWLGILFAVFTAIAAFGIGNMVQANSIATMSKEVINCPEWLTGLVLTVATALVILGGVKSIAKVCTALVPLMAIFYVVGCALILFINRAFLAESVSVIVIGAFTPSAVAGGFAGSTLLLTMRYGMARGLFSNESGLGSAPIVAAAAKTRNPVRQALVSATGTFWDTVVICAMTGLVLVSTFLRSPETFTGLKGAQLAKTAFSQIPILGPLIITVGLLTFVFSTILGWSYYGERAIEYIFGKKSILPYRAMWVIAVLVGSIIALPIVWDFADAANALMALPNLVSLLLLSSVIVAETKKYLWDDKLDESTLK